MVHVYCQNNNAKQCFFGQVLILNGVQMFRLAYGTAEVNPWNYPSYFQSGGSDFRFISMDPNKCALQLINLQDSWTYNYTFLTSAYQRHIVA